MVQVPPGTYKHKYSIDELLKKKVSTRGPYDLFSEERSGPPKTGHFIQDSNPILGPGELLICLNLSKLLAIINNFKGHTKCVHLLMI